MPRFHGAAFFMAPESISGDRSHGRKDCQPVPSMHQDNAGNNGDAMSDNVAVFGILPSRAAAENAVTQLREAGFISTDVSILAASPEDTRGFAHENMTKAPEGGAAGAVAGATVGGVLGWLAGIGSIAIPGVGPFIAAGPIMGALAGIGVGGTVGGLSGTLIGLGIPEYEARRYEGRINKGGILISVHTEEELWRKRAREVLERCGAEDIHEGDEQRDSDSKRDREFRPHV